MNRQIKNILSIDGGGTKILYSVRILESLNLNIYDNFDTFIGVSSGAFMASIIACNRYKIN